MIDYELFVFRYVRRPLRERKLRENMAARNPGDEERAAIFFPAVFFRVTNDGRSERGTTRSLIK